MKFNDQHRVVSAISDRFRDLPENEQRLASLRRDGEMLVDRSGRARVPLGDGFESQLARATHGWIEPKSPPITETITAAETKRAWCVAATSAYNGYLLNTFVTIAWGVADGVDDARARGMHVDLWKRMGAWFRDERHRQALRARERSNAAASPFPFSAIWVLEVGKVVGLHSHLIVHVPAESRMDFKNWLLNVAHKVVGAPKVTLTTQASINRLVHMSNLADENAQCRVFRYMFKGLDPDDTFSVLDVEYGHQKHLAAEFLAIRARPQGRIVGKRTGCSNAFGPSQQPGWLENSWKHSLQGNLGPAQARFVDQGEVARILAGIEN